MGMCMFIKLQLEGKKLLLLGDSSAAWKQRQALRGCTNTAVKPSWVGTSQTSGTWFTFLRASLAFPTYTEQKVKLLWSLVQLQNDHMWCYLREIWLVTRNIHGGRIFIVLTVDEPPYKHLYLFITVCCYSTLYFTSSTVCVVLKLNFHAPGL